MYNPIRFVKDIIDLLKNPPGEPTHAAEITPANIEMIRTYLNLESRTEKYAKIGDFFVSYEEMNSIIPCQEFHEHYAFTETPSGDPMDVTPIRTIKPI